MTAHAGPLPVPARITLALNAAQLYGPQVDIDLGGVEPMVDDWEAGKNLPTTEQVERLAKLTGRPVSFFYEPMDEWWGDPVRMFLCDRSRRTHGLTIVESYVDWDGVLHIEELTPPKPPHRPRPSVQDAPPPARRITTGAAPRGAHVPHESPDVPGVCAHCQLPLGVPNARHLVARDTR